MHEVIQFLKKNPQAAILLAICVVLGVGTLIALMIASLTPTADTGSSGGDAGVVMAIGWLFG
jgi:hypothetical protein